jgi:hypothetical protein
MAELKEHLKLDKAGIPSLTAALLEVCPFTKSGPSWKRLY